LTESLALHRSVGDRRGIASTLNNLADAADLSGDPETAMGLYRESHTLALEGGNRLYAAIAMENLAELMRLRGEDSVAQTRYREALLLYRTVADQQGIINCLGGLALVAIGQNRVEEAVVLLGAASHLSDSQNLPPLPGLEETIASLENTLGNEAFKAAWKAGEDMPIVDVIDFIAEQIRLPSSSMQLAQ
jgi:hypothetical protein